MTKAGEFTTQLKCIDTRDLRGELCHDPQRHMEDPRVESRWPGKAKKLKLGPSKERRHILGLFELFSVKIG